MDFDQALKTVGEFGPFQKKIFSGLCFSSLVTMFQMVLIVLIGAKPDFLCYKRGVLVQTNNTCAASCDLYQYKSKFSSITSEWDLICDQAYRVSLVQSIFMAGVLVGALAFGVLSDRVGRKVTLFYALTVTALSSVAGAWCGDWTTFMVLRFVTGFHNSGSILCTYVITMELIGNSWRTFCGTVLQMFAAGGIVLYALLGYVYTDWRSLVFVVSVLTLPALLLYPFIPESPRWLVARGRVHEAELVLDKIAVKNGISAKKVILAGEVPDAGGKSAGAVLELVRNNILCRYTASLFYTWFVCSGVYYGLTTSAGSLGHDMYSSLALSGMVELPANLMVMCVLACVGRRFAICSFLVLAGLSCGLLTFVSEDNKEGVTALAMLGKLAVTASFSLVYLWSAEIFPTFVRNGAMGVMSVGARFGGIVSPAIVLLGDYWFPLPYLVYGALCTSAGVLCCSLPETRNQPLPDTTDDLLRIGGHFVDSDDITWSTELLQEERSVGLKTKSEGKTGSKDKSLVNHKVS